MPMHLDEEELILHHYGEGAAGAAAHLEECEACRAGYAALRRTLEAVAAGPVPERGEDYGSEVWRRVQPRLRDEARVARVLRFRPPAWLATAAVAASLVVAFLLGRGTAPPAAPSPSPREVVRVRDRILLVAVGDHLDRSRMVLVELMNAGAAKGPVDVRSEREWAATLLANNRLYRQTAAQVGEPAVAGVLDDLERVLVEVANGPGELTAAQVRALRERIGAKGLLFKVRVLGAQVREREKAPPRPAKLT